MTASHYVALRNVVFVSSFGLAMWLMDWEYGLEGSPISLALIVGGWAAGALAHFRSRQLRAHARLSRPDNPLRDARPDVLYLRAFGSDPTMAGAFRGGWSSAEEELAEAVRPIGDLVAVGRPGEPLPTPGAARMYADNDRWQSVVEAQMRAAALTIIRVGAGAGLRWECERAFKLIPAERLVLLVLDTTLTDWNTFRTDLQAVTNVSLPDVPRTDVMRRLGDYRNWRRVTPGFVRFGDKWQGEFLPLPRSLFQFGYFDMVKPMRRALHPVFAACGVAWAPATRRPHR